MNAEQRAAVERMKAFTANLYGFPAATEILKDFEQIESLITDLAKDKARLDEALRLVEWAGRTDDDENWGIHTCPICDGYKAIGHLEDCQLKAALTPAAMEVKS